MESPSAFSSMSDLPSFSRDDIRYAAEMTRVVYEPVSYTHLTLPTT